MSALLRVEVAGEGAGQGAVADDDLALPAHDPDLSAGEVTDVGDDGRTAATRRGGGPAGSRNRSRGGGAGGGRARGADGGGTGHGRGDERAAAGGRAVRYVTRYVIRCVIGLWDGL
jgi:hypothetical protein